MSTIMSTSMSSSFAEGPERVEWVLCHSFFIQRQSGSDSDLDARPNSSESPAPSRMVGKTELFLICLVAVALLAIVARKIRVPYPILLTIGGVILALVPGLPAIQLDPQLVFNLFLPPL